MEQVRIMRRSTRSLVTKYSELFGSRRAASLKLNYPTRSVIQYVYSNRPCPQACPVQHVPYEAIIRKIQDDGPGRSINRTITWPIMQSRIMHHASCRLFSNKIPGDKPGDHSGRHKLGSQLTTASHA